MSKENKKLLIWFLIWLIIFLFANYITTPKECRGNDIEKLSQFCIDLRFP